MNYSNISVSSETYKKMTTEDKLRVVNAKLKDLFVNDGKKTATVIYKGRKKIIKSDKIGVFKDLLEREKALEKQIIVNAINNNVVSSSVSSTSAISASVKSNSDNKNREKKKNIKKVFAIPLLASLIAKVSKVMNKKVLSDKCSKVLSFGQKMLSKFKKINLKDIKNKFISNNTFNKSKRFVKEKTSKIASLGKKKINKIGNNKTVRNIKNKISNINYKKVVKRASVWICTFALVMTGLLVSSRNNRKSQSEVDDFNKVTTSQTDPTMDDVNKIEETTVNENDDEVVVAEDTTLNTDTLPEQAEEKITFDDVLTINDNSYIYTNSYDASYNTNMYNPYFDGSYDREVQGIVYELNGNIYTVYENDVNSMQIQKELENAGATALAVLVTRSDLVSTGEYEGYYNVNSVRVKSR